MLNQNAETPRQFSIAFDFDNQGTGRITKGSFECSYGQTSSGSVAIQALTLKAEGRQFQSDPSGKGRLLDLGR